MGAVKVCEAFRERFGREPEGVWEAPGRVNLIGDHTDYNDGFVLPLALEQRATVAAARRRDGLLRVVSLERGEAELRLDRVAPGAIPGWPAYAAGPLWALGAPDGLDLVLTSDVPIGSGLASSAAVGCAVLLAARDLHGGPNDPAELALLAQQAENEIAGVPSGVMDQMASFSCRSGHALLLDCRSLSIEHVPLRLAVANLTLLVIDTRTPRSLVSEAYEARRRACEAAARALGVPALRDADEAGLARFGGTLGRRARHVVGEIARVLELAELLRSGRVEEAGSLLSASHASLRDDFEVSTTALDLAVDAAIAGGALGARMTGAGFGGCVVALARADTGQAVRDAVRAAFARNRLASPVFISARGAGGARRA